MPKCIGCFRRAGNYSRWVQLLVVYSPYRHFPLSPAPMKAMLLCAVHSPAPHHVSTVACLPLLTLLLATTPAPLLRLPLPYAQRVAMGAGEWAASNLVPHRSCNLDLGV